jgi:uncharacterized protein YkwD
VRNLSTNRFLGLIALAGAGLAAAGCTGSPAAAGTGAPSGFGGTVAGTTQNSTCTVPQNDDSLADEVLQLVNLERAQHGLDPVTFDPALSRVAEDYACEMIDQTFFDHVNPYTGVGPGQRLTDAGYPFHSMGENLAAGQTTAREAVEAWLDSPGHRENMLAPQWRRTGIGVRYGGPYRVMWVQEFADPLDLMARATSIDALADEPKP